MGERAFQPILSTVVSVKNSTTHEHSGDHDGVARRKQALIPYTSCFVSNEKEYLILIVNRSESETVSPGATWWLFDGSQTFKFKIQLIEHQNF